MHIAQNAFVEQRRKKREPSQFRLHYTVVDKAGAPAVDTRTVDVSSAGIAFDTSQLLVVDTKIDAQLTVPFLNHEIQFSGIIKRVEAIGPNLFRCGLAFEQIKPEDVQILESYVQTLDVDSILRAAIKKGATDVHFVVERPPMVRLLGDLIPLPDENVLSHDDLRSMFDAILTVPQKDVLRRELELDFSYSLPEGTGFRANAHFEKGNLEVAFRILPDRIKTLDELGFPPIMYELAKKRKGLIIITGTAGSGKSTTLAAMIDVINRERKCMVISIEDPIEYIHHSKSSIIKQREVGTDTLSFAAAIKHSLRQDPNVLLIGEIRDLESISMAITAAETGHLVLTTMHTINCIESINRIVDVYPANQQDQVLSQLSGCLEAVVSQLLFARKDGTGMALAVEVMLTTAAIRNLIRTKKFEQIYSYLQSGERLGMQTLDSSLLRLVNSGIVDMESVAPFVKDQKLLHSEKTSSDPG